MKATITVTQDGAVLAYVANVDNAQAIAMLEAAKYAILRQAMGGVGRPPEEPQAPASGGFRAPGLSVRKVDG